MSATTNYFVACVYNGCTSLRTKVTVDYLPESCEYCDPGNLSCSNNEMITKIVIKKGSSVILSNSSTCSGPGGYSFFNSSAVALERGETYQITTDNPGIWATAVKAWIDYNGNGSFEANEEVFSYGITRWTSQTQSFTVPNNTVSGEVRMRVKLLFNYPPEPCVQARNLGETEDYLIHLVELSPCQSVLTLTSPADIRAQEHISYEQQRQGVRSMPKTKSIIQPKSLIKLHLYS